VIKKLAIGLFFLVLMLLVGFYVLLTWRPKWDPSKDAGFIIDNIKISNVTLQCGKGEQGHIITYKVDCRVEMDVEHDEQFVPNGKVLLLSRWKPLELISKTDMDNLKRLRDVYPGFVPKGAIYPLRLGSTYSAVVETRVLPLFVLDPWVESKKRVTSHIQSKFIITVSMLKCEIFRVGGQSFYQCFDFGSK
jgi:hypothetical protein